MTSKPKMSPLLILLVFMLVVFITGLPQKGEESLEDSAPDPVPANSAKGQSTMEKIGQLGSRLEKFNESSKESHGTNKAFHEKTSVASQSTIVHSRDSRYELCTSTMEDCVDYDAFIRKRLDQDRNCDLDLGLVKVIGSMCLAANRSRTTSACASLLNGATDNGNLCPEFCALESKDKNKGCTKGKGGSCGGNGLCTYTCTDATDCQVSPSQCVHTLKDFSHKYCAKECTSDLQCGAGTACLQYAGDKVCRSFCTDKRDCASHFSCEPDTQRGGEFKFCI